MAFAYRSLLSTITLAAVTAAAQPVEPWHQHNANLPQQTGDQKQVANPAAVMQPVVIPIPAPAERKDSQPNPMQQVLQQMLGRSEIAGTGDSNTGTDPGHSSSLDVGGPAGTGPNGTPLVNVNGCTTQMERFQFKGGHGNESGCERDVTVSEEFAEFMNNNLNRCAKIAAGINSFEVGKIWHAGTMPSKEHMAKSPRSLHNFGMAVDITAIQMDNRKFVFANAKSDPATAQFTAKFRQCWGEAVEGKRPGCLGSRKGGHPQGTIGHEDHDHGKHLHISLPFCRQQARALGGVNIALKIFQSWFINLAHADSVAKEKTDLPAPKFTYKNLPVHNGQAKLTVKDTHGEPISAGFRISLEVTCSKNKQKAELLKELEACSFDDFRFDKKEGFLEVAYRTSVFEGGRVVCRKTEVAKFKGRCP